MKNLWKVLVLTLSINLTAQELPFAKNTVVLKEGKNWINIMSSLEELHDSSTDRRIEYPLSKKDNFKQVPSTMKSWTSPDTNINSGVWFRVKLRNENLKESIFVLNDTYYAKIILFFLLDENGKILSEKKIGFGTDYKDSFLKFNSNSISFDLQYGKEVYLYLFLYSEGFQFPNFEIFTWKEQIYFEHYRTMYLYLYYGIVLSIFFYNLFLFFSTKDITYFYYCLYVLFSGLFFFFYQQQGSFWNLKIIQNYGDYFITIIGLILIISMIQFILAFLNLQKVYKKTYFILNGISLFSLLFIILLFCLMPFSFSHNYLNNLTSNILHPILLLTDIFIAYLAISASRNGFVKAKYFLLAWLLLLLGTFYAFLINLLNLFNLQLFSSWGIGFLIISHINMALGAIEMILLSFALGDRYNQIQKENERAKRVLLEQEIQLKVAEATKKKLELGMLKQTIQPHFLMNSLNTILSLIRENPEQASLFVNSLGLEIRTMLDVSSERLIPISIEFEICKSHLEIMQIRLERKFTWNTEGISGEEKIPPLIIQTLLENAFTHSIGYIGDIDFLLTRINFQNVQTTNRIPKQNNHELIEAQNTIESIYEFHSTYDDSYLANQNLPKTKSLRSGEDGTGTMYIKSRLEESYGLNWSFSQGWENQSWVVRIGVGR